MGKGTDGFGWERLPFSKTVGARKLIMARGIEKMVGPGMAKELRSSRLRRSRFSYRLTMQLYEGLEAREAIRRLGGETLEELWLEDERYRDWEEEFDRSMWARYMALDKDDIIDSTDEPEHPGTLEEPMESDDDDWLKELFLEGQLI